MANKFAVVFLVCIVVAATMHLSQSTETPEQKEKFKSCFGNCEEECKVDGNGRTYCEMKCDTDCDDKETADRLNIKI